MQMDKVKASGRQPIWSNPKVFAKAGEVLAVAAFIAAENRFGSSEPGFASSPINPYVIFCLLASVWFGSWYGLLAYAASLASLLLPFPQGGGPASLASAFLQHRIPLLWTLIAVYVFGLVHEHFLDQLDAKKRFLRRSASEKARLDTEVKALIEVNRDLEERVLRQQESITSLFARIREMTTQSVGETLAVLLDMVCQYSWASKASVWSYRAEDDCLVREATVGWEDDEKDLLRIPAAESIEGWVARNNLVFSARMLVSYANLRRLDKGRNLLAFPISFGKSVWGVLNIEDMPFSKFNLYTEKILSVLIELGAPAIERTVANERLMFAELHPLTAFPLYSVLRRKMDQWADSPESQKSSFSVIILELDSMKTIIESFGEAKAYALLKRCMGEIKTLSGNVLEPYHYAKEGQIALFYPQIDFDGTALFCFDLLGMLNGKTWEIDEKVVPMDLFLGYANSGKGKIEADAILRVAEEVLEKQKRQP
jgi:GGDEF domain-containing protein